MNPANKTMPLPATNQSRASNTGDIAVYMALLLLVVITSSAIFLNSLIAGKIQAVGDVADAEQAFYATNSGLEDAFFRAADSGETGALEGTIELPEDRTAVYTGTIELTDDNVPIGCFVGEFRDQKRRLSVGGGECIE